MTLFHRFSMSSHKSSLLMRPRDLFTTIRMGSLLWKARFQVIYWEGLSSAFLYRQGHGEPRESLTSGGHQQEARFSLQGLMEYLLQSQCLVKEIPAASCELDITRMTFFASQMQTHDFWNIFHHTIPLQMVVMEFICCQKLVFLSWVFHGFPRLRKAAFEEAQPQVSGITFIKREGSEAVPKDSSHQPWAEG